MRSNGTDSIGALGFVPPSLLSTFAFPKSFFHNGVAVSLEEVLENTTHRSAGTGVDVLGNAADREKLVKFLLSIDAKTRQIKPTPLP